MNRMKIGQSAYDLLEKISYERLGGSEEELKALKTIKRHIKVNTNLEPEILNFDVDFYEIKSAKFSVTKPKFKEFEVTAFGMCGSTKTEKEFFYLENDKEIESLYLEDKILLLNTRLTYDTYEKLMKKKVAGIIVPSGSIYDDLNNTDLEVNKLRERHYKNGIVPCVTIRMKDVEELIKMNPKKVCIQIEQQEMKKQSSDLVVTIPGTKYPDEIIAFTAHYDSVRFSTGAYDNGTGAVTIYEVLKYYNENRPDRTLKFIFCGSEEYGLLGSHAYVNQKENELDKYKACFNVDMTGVVIGKNIVCCTSKKDDMHYIDAVSKIRGYQVDVYQGVYSSDSTPFANKEIPSFSFARISPRGGAEIHSRKDQLFLINKQYLEDMILYIIDITKDIVNAKYFPFSKGMPEEMRKDLNKYLGVKDDKI